MFLQFEDKFREWKADCQLGKKGREIGAENAIPINRARLPDRLRLVVERLPLPLHWVWILPEFSKPDLLSLPLFM